MSNTIELNPNRQYILCGDISASMDTKDPNCGGLSRFNYMLEKFKSFIKESQDFDPDGPIIFLFGECAHKFVNTQLEEVEKKLASLHFEGFTNTHLVIDEAWKIHKEEKSKLAKDRLLHPGTVVLIFTDGAPTNHAAVERKIIEIANAIDREDEFNISLILVGTIDPQLKSFLDKIDNGLSDKVKYDILGTTTIEGLTFMKSVDNAING